MVAAGPAFVKWVCCKHRPYYFHYSILFVWGSLVCWESKRWYVLHSQSQANACREVCSPADNVHTVRAPSQGSNSISRTKVVFHFILSKRSVYSLMCSAWTCWLNISYRILVCAFKTCCLFTSLLRYFLWLIREGCCAGVLRAGTSRDSLDFFCWDFTITQSSCFSFWLLYPSFLACSPVQWCISSWMIFLAVV